MLDGEGTGDELASGRVDGRREDGGGEDGAVEDQEGRREEGVRGKGAGDGEVGTGIGEGNPRSSSSRHWNHWGLALTVGSLEAPASPSPPQPAHPHLGALG